MARWVKDWLLILIVLVTAGILTGRNTANAMAELELIPISIVDNGPLPNHIPFNNLAAFDVLVPKNWDYRGGVAWNLKTTQLATFGVRLTGSDGATGIHVHPFVNYIWAPHQGIGGPNAFIAQEGDYISGALVQRPLTAVEYLWNNVINVKRPPAEPVEEEPLPRMAAQAMENQLQVPGLRAEAVRVRARYVENDMVIEEDFYTAIIYFENAGTLRYTPVHLYSLRAPQGQLDASSGFLYTLVRTISIKPVWFANYHSIAQIALEARINEIQLAAAISRLLVQDARHIHASLMAEWEQQQAVRNHILEASTDAILGVANFRIPSTGEVIKLTNDYQHVWLGTDGSYLFSNDPLYNPNTDPLMESNLWFEELIRDSAISGGL